MPERRRLPFELTATSILKVIIAVICVWAWLRIWQFALAVVVSIFVAVAVEPVVRWLETRRVPRWLAACAPILLFVVLIGGFLAAAWSSITDQAAMVGPELVKIEKRVQSIPMIGDLLKGSLGKEGASFLKNYGSAVGQSALRAVLLVAIGLVLTVYLLLEREKTFEWVITFVPRRHRPKARLTASKAREVVFGYALGNIATSFFATVFVFVALTALKVPAALLLALLAGLFDFIPVLGFVLSAAPAVLLAMTVSPTSGILVVVLFLAYHFLESYLIAPRIYAGRLRLSNVAILISFAVGAELAGAIGAILALPIAAIYPAVEQIWLSDYLGEDVVADHQEQMADGEE